MKNFLLVVSFVALTIAGFAQGYKVGDAIPEFKLKNVDGKMVSFADYPNAKGYIVIFTCNTCPYSKAYENRIIEIHNKYAPMGYPVIAINPNDENRVPEDSYEHMKKRAKEKKFPFAYLQDETQEIAKNYGATRTPHVFVVQNYSKGRNLAYIGAIDDSAMNESDVGKKYLEEALASLMKGQKPDPDYTLAVGCTIKWKK